MATTNEPDLASQTTTYRLDRALQRRDETWVPLRDLAHELDLPRQTAHRAADVGEELELFVSELREGRYTRRILRWVRRRDR